MKRALLVLCLLAGCEVQTEVMVVIKAAKSLPYGDGQAIDAIRLEGQAADDQSDLFTYQKVVDLCSLDHEGEANCRPEKTFVAEGYDGKVTLPLHILMRPGTLGDDVTVRTYILAEQTLSQTDPDGNIVSVTHQRLRTHLEFKFSPHHRLWIDVPLYGECLDQHACEETNRICKVDCPAGVDGLVPQFCCGDVGPTADEDDGVLPEAPDLSEARDLTPLPEVPDLDKPCGQDGLICCGGTTCNDLTLQCAGGYCSKLSTTCGVIGKPCCGGTMCTTGTCSGGTCVSSCGGDGQTCCAGRTCSLPGEECFGGDLGTCAGCGAVTEACCPPGNTCGGGTLCNGTACTPCGASMDPCCPVSAQYPNGCAGDMGLICNPSMTCVGCGGTVGAPCCSGGGCGAPTTLTCKTGSCASCGMTMQPCCAEAGNTCATNNLCNGGTGKCEHCGLSGEPCCATNPQCTTAGSTCDGTTGKCKPAGACGVSNGDACCPGDTCPGTMTSQMLYCNMTGGGGTCLNCGNAGQPCCPGTKACAGGHTCGGDMGLQSLRFSPSGLMVSPVGTCN